MGDRLTAGQSDPHLEIEMPKRFILELETDDSGWMGCPDPPQGLFQSPPGGSHLGAEARPVWMGCIAHHGDWFEQVNSGGVHRYRLVPQEPGD
jgi:hypothetical protein